MTGGTASHGWPDDGYFDRLISECAANGVFSDEWEANRAKEMREHRIARQKSADAKKKKKKEEEEEGKKEEEKDPSDLSDPSELTSPEIESIRAKMAELSKGIQVAMKSGDRKKIMELMRERNQMQAKVNSLQEQLAVASEKKDNDKNNDSNEKKNDDGKVDDDDGSKEKIAKLQARLSEIQKEFSKAMQTQNRGEIIRLMQERRKITSELSVLERDGEKDE